MTPDRATEAREDHASVRFSRVERVAHDALRNAGALAGLRTVRIDSAVWIGVRFYVSGARAASVLRDALHAAGYAYAMGPTGLRFEVGA